MKPIKFPQSNSVLVAPRNMDSTVCENLHIFREENNIISCWQISWKELFKLFRTRKIWLYVYSYSSSPPVALEIKDPWKTP